MTRKELEREAFKAREAKRMAERFLGQRDLISARRTRNLDRIARLVYETDRDDYSDVSDEQ